MPEATDPVIIWRAVLGRLQQEIPKEHFDTFLRPCVGHEWDGETLTVAAAGSFAVSWLELPLHLSMATEALTKTVGKDCVIRYEAIPDVAQQGDGADARGTVHRSRSGRISGDPPHAVALEDMEAGRCNPLVSAYIRDWVAGGAGGWLVLMGASLSNSTEVAVATMHLLAEAGHDALYTTADGLIRDHQKAAAAAAAGKPFADHHRYAEWDVLLLDDLRIARTEWACETLASVLRERARRRSSTIITTQLDIDGLHALCPDLARAVCDPELTAIGLP